MWKGEQNAHRTQSDFLSKSMLELLEEEEEEEAKWLINIERLKESNFNRCAI